MTGDAMTGDAMTGDALTERFARVFDGPPDLVVRSPGRVNLIGEHTDYNDGWVLPMAIDLGTDVAARRRHDATLRVVALKIPGDDAEGTTDGGPAPARDLTQTDDLRPSDGPDWTRYVRGSAAMVSAAGHDVAADLLIDSNLPIGAGLSSSASLELGVAVALLGLSGAGMEPTALARLGQRVENDIVGVNTGIMDQLAVACGVAGRALLIDCRSADTEPVPIPPAVRVLVINSAVPRALAGSAYNQRRAECESALRALRAAEPALRALRDVTPELLDAEGGRLSEVELRRARHVVTENGRVLDSAAALRAGDVGRFGRLMADSHASLRDDYAVSSPQLDTLVSIAEQVDGVLGARLTGAGFGGCAVALVSAARAAPAAATITGRYRAATGLPGDAWICTPSEGTHVRWRQADVPTAPGR
jgi:galactokinase